MFVTVDDVTITNVWEASFKDRETHEDVKYYRALLTKTGEPPAQLAVTADDFETLRDCIGVTGRMAVEIDAQPGRRVRVRLRGVE